jgi:hypothetical protein
MRVPALYAWKLDGSSVAFPAELLYCLHSHADPAPLEDTILCPKEVQYVSRLMGGSDCVQIGLVANVWPSVMQMLRLVQCLAVKKHQSTLVKEMNKIYCPAQVDGDDCVVAQIAELHRTWQILVPLMKVPTDNQNRHG